MAESQGPLSGGCNCGAVRYTLSARPFAVAACHCVNCRRQSGAAFSVNLVVRADAMKVDGDLRTFVDADTESGQPVERQFCGACGSPIRSVPRASPMIVAVKAGTLDEPDAFPPAMHIWTSSALPWVTIPADLPKFAKGPGT